MLSTHHKNIAAALQLRLEEVVLSQLKYLKNKYKVRNICLSGGVALNCSMNGKISKSKFFDKIFVQPASGDAGLAIGAAINCSLEVSPEKKLDFETNCYLGSRYSNNLIKKVINKYKDKIYNLNHHRLVDNPEIEIKKLINFCGLEWDENCLKHETNTRPIKTVSFNQARKPIYKESVRNVKLYEQYLTDLKENINN